jgi:hypothetical protein
MREDSSGTSKTHRAVNPAALSKGSLIPLPLGRAMAVPSNSPQTTNLRAPAEKGVVGAINRIIRAQPAITISLAFGLGLVVTTLLARRKK